MHMTQTEATDLMIAHQRAAARHRRNGDNDRADAHMARARALRTVANR